MHTADLAQPAHQPAQPSPLGPDSLTWKYFGDLRTGMLGVWIGSLQNMYPQLGAGVEERWCFLFPVAYQVRRNDDQGRPGLIGREEAQRLDGFPQSHFVGKQGSPVREHPRQAFALKRA